MQKPLDEWVDDNPFRKETEPRFALMSKKGQW